MNKYNHYYGIDISKDVFDVMDERGSHYQIENTSTGFKQVKKKIQERSGCVREASGVYQVPLAEFLYERGVFVSVVNLLVIKRFIQMNLRRIKTDKADAAMICKYAQLNGLKLYKPAPVYVKESRIIAENIDLLIKSRTMFKNRLHAMAFRVRKHRLILINPLKRTVKDLTIQIQKREGELKKLIEENEPELFIRLQSIPA